LDTPKELFVVLKRTLLYHTTHAMKVQDLKKLNTPNSAGIYKFLAPRRKILYIGKAINLKSRTKSYFDKDIAKTRGAHIQKMVEEAKTIEYIRTDSILEAILLEVQLIKKYQPPYNTKEKDDKSFNYVIITREDFPRVLLMRGKELFGHKASRKLKTDSYKPQTIYGPFPSGIVLKDALKIIRKILPFRDKCLPDSKKPCFNRQIGLCPGVCTGEITKTEYAKTISDIKNLFEGKKGRVLSRLKKEMREYSKKLEFEKATLIKRKIFALEHIADVALMKDDSLRTPHGFRVEGYDIAHTSGKYAVGVMTVVENSEPEPSEYRKFRIKSFEGADDTRALAEILSRRLTHTEWLYPKLIAIDGGRAQKNIAEKVLREAGVCIPVVSIVKNERHAPKDILGRKDLRTKYEKDILLANNEAHRFAISYHRKLRGNLKQSND